MGRLKAALNRQQANRKIKQAVKAEKFEKLNAKTKAATDAPHRKPPVFPYDESDVILLVGEGNFSFAHALAEALHGAAEIYATAYDTEQVLLKKYTDAVEHIQAINELGGTVLFRVDATKLDSCKPLKGKRFTKIVFNFPHTGAGVKDQDRNIRVNQQLIYHFLVSAASFVTSEAVYGDAADGEIHITLKEGSPYDLWDIKRQAKETRLLACTRSFRFAPELYKEYAHRRTIGFAEGLSKEDNEEILKKGSRTYVFTVKKVDDDPKARDNKKSRKPRQKKGDDSDSDDDR
ncbi:hypothetical protein BC832DRAFT_537198 [Gaertneriomyces semiglobifer]|nr:hypothetical protein BC832DRAFT_537198 [Gaertneriomyces semiglobifer]